MITLTEVFSKVRLSICLTVFVIFEDSAVFIWETIHKHSKQYPLFQTFKFHSFVWNIKHQLENCIVLFPTIFAVRGVSLGPEEMGASCRNRDKCSKKYKDKMEPGYQYLLIVFLGIILHICVTFPYTWSHVSRSKCIL